ncbi:cytochrome P460 family protein [Chloroflexi bacterium TSY]|nr:cytochrome P460 family protein [Chloroflexi bacterium TSY]
MSFANKITLIIAVVVIASLIVVACQTIPMPADASHDAPTLAESYFEINDQGELLRPDFDFRETWIYIGTPLTPNDLNDGQAPFPEFHNVYIDPVSFKAYKETGEFPERTILIKELISVGDKSAPSGNGYFMGDFIGLEATIKSAEYFPNEPGNWAYFSFTNTEEHGDPLADTATAFPTDSCNACHELFAGETDFVFAAYYPVLRAANPNIDIDDSEAISGGAMSSDDAQSSSEEANQTIATGSAVMLGGTDALGGFLVDSNGMTLYLFAEDEPGISKCDANCLLIWPPLLTDGEPVAGEGVDAALLGTTTLANGATQVTYNGWPLYYFARDVNPGDTAGQERGDVWFVITAEGEGVFGESAENENAAVDSASAVTLEVRAGDLYFGEAGSNNLVDPPVWTVPSGAVVTLTFINEGKVQHNWAIINLGEEVPVPYIEDISIAYYTSPLVDGGTEQEFTFTAPSEPGEYIVICTPPGHYPLMQGRLVVE